VNVKGKACEMRQLMPVEVRTLGIEERVQPSVNA